ncbi:MAG: hypothetical protein ACE5OR_05420 [bacterium]
MDTGALYSFVPEDYLERIEVEAFKKIEADLGDYWRLHSFTMISAKPPSIKGSGDANSSLLHSGL